MRGILTLHRLAEDEEPTRHIPAVAPWAYEASWPPLHWLIGDYELARRTFARWMARDTSEASIRRVTLLLEEERHAAGIITVPGAELAKCCHADTLALVAAVGRGERAGLLRRLRIVAELQSPVGPNDIYISRVWVPAEQRGKGHARVLMEETLAACRRAGFTRYRLDVRPDNEVALRLYGSLGFRRVAVHRAEGVSCVSMALDS